jgi:membrane protein DedA with SNARE-associated domain
VDFWRGWPFPAAVAMLFVVAVLRAGATYALGRAAQTGARHTRIAKLMARPGFDRVRDLVARWGAPVVTLSFLTVGVQTLVNLVAGMTQMPLRRYLPALAAGSLLWGLLYATVGFAGVTAWWQLYKRSSLDAVVLLVVVVLGVAAYVLRQVRLHRSARVASDAH